MSGRGGRMICEYFETCKTAKETGRDCADYETCDTYKMFEKMGVRFYGQDAMGVEDVKRLGLGLEKEVEE